MPQKYISKIKRGIYKTRDLQDGDINSLDIMLLIRYLAGFEDALEYFAEINK